MQRLTPRLNTKGIFSPIVPFSVLANTLYNVTAIGTIQDAVDKGNDILNLLYIAKGLTQEDYLLALQEQVEIITLTPINGPAVVIPATHIGPLPENNTVSYIQKVVNVNLGPLPVALGIQETLTQITQVCTDTIGIIPSLQQGTLGLDTEVLYEEHLLLEQARLNQTSVIITEQSRREKAEQRVEILEQKIASLQRALILKQEQLEALS